MKPSQKKQIPKLSPQSNKISNQNFNSFEDPTQLQTKMKTTVSRWYILVRIIILLPLSVISRIASVYFLVNIVLSSTERFDTWWKVLSFVGYIFYFTVGSILFFFIAPSLEIEVGRKEKSHGYFGNIFGELKGLVFRNRYQLPQTYSNIESQKRPTKNRMGQLNPQVDQTINKTQKVTFDLAKKSYFTNILKQSSLEKDTKVQQENSEIRSLKQKIEQLQQRLKRKQYNEQNQKLLEKKNNLRSQEKFNDKQLNGLSSIQLKNNFVRQEKKNNSKFHPSKLQSEEIIELKKQIQKLVKQINLPPKSLHKQEKKIFEKYIQIASSHKFQQKYEKDQVIKQLIDQRFKFLVDEINFQKKYGRNQDRSFFYRILLQQIVELKLLVCQIDRLPENQKQLLISHILVKKQLKQLNKIQVRQKKFYLFLFNLINATDAMIAWYDYYQLPDAKKFQKFQSYYYFLILCFEQIPQIMAQGFSLSYIDENKINIAIFAISIIKLFASTVYKLYDVFTSENTQTQAQKQHRQHQHRIKRFEYYRALPNSNLKFLQISRYNSNQIILLRILVIFLGIIFIGWNLLPITNRIMLYMFFQKVRQQDSLIYWSSIICLVYYIFVGNFLAVKAFPMSEQDLIKYQQKLFGCNSLLVIRFIIGLLVVILNTLNCFMIPIVLFGIWGYLDSKDKSFGRLFTKFYFRSVYIYFSFEAIPFMIIYSLGLSRSKNKDSNYNYEVALLVLTVTNLVFTVIWVIFMKFMMSKKEASDDFSEVIIDAIAQAKVNQKINVSK